MSIILPITTQPITITTQPVGATVVKNSGGTLFTVVASAVPTAHFHAAGGGAEAPDDYYVLTGPLRYEWYENNVKVPAPFGQGSTPLPMLPISASTSYYVNVIALYTNLTLPDITVILKSDVVTLTVIDRPELADDQPGLELKQINEGGSASLSVVLKPSPNNTQFYYQWYEGASGLESNPIEAAINSSYTTPNLTSTQTYWVKAYNLYNDYGNSINSPSVRVEILSSPQSDRQSNINKINSLTGGTNGDKLVDLDFKQLSSDFVDEVVQIEAQKLLAAFPSIPDIPGTSAVAYITDTLNNFDEAQVRIVSQAQSIVDCAKDIPQRLINAGIALAKKLLLNLISNITGIAVSDLIALANALAKIIEVWDQFILSIVSAAVGELVSAVSEATAAAEAALGEVLAFCNSLPYTLSDGTVVGAPTNIPVGKPPLRVAGVSIPVGTAGYNSRPKGEYDLFTFQLKEYIDTDPNVLALYSGTDRENYVSSISYLHTIALAYHDKITKTEDNSQDIKYREEFNTSITNTAAQNPSWSNEIRNDFTNRAEIISEVIARNTQVIRNFYMPSGSGNWLPWYMSAYGHVKADDGSTLDQTTADDISSGKIKETWQYLGNRNNKLVKGTSVASNYFKHGTVLDIRFADTKAPVGSGRVRVDDIGGMSPNVIDYFVAGDTALKKQITSGSKNQGGKTDPSYTTPIEIRIVSGGPA